VNAIFKKRAVANAEEFAVQSSGPKVPPTVSPKETDGLKDVPVELWLYVPRLTPESIVNVGEPSETRSTN
jgi:hypothetical protein